MKPAGPDFDEVWVTLAVLVLLAMVGAMLWLRTHVPDITVWP